jgi:hypothetical protein
MTCMYSYPDASDNDLIELYSGVLPAPGRKSPPLRSRFSYASGAIIIE